MQMHGAQHIGQHMVGFYFEVVGLQFDRHMAVAQVISRTREVKRTAVCRVMRDAQYRLRRGQYLQQRTVFAHQHIAAAHHLPAVQKHTDIAAG